jgi:hypothetical protein
MLVKKQAAMLKKLKQQVSVLKQKEKITHRKLHKALIEVKKIAHSYEKKLVKKSRDTQVKMAAAEVAIYARLAESIRQHAEDIKKARQVLEKKRLLPRKKKRNSSS